MLAVFQLFLGQTTHKHCSHSEPTTRSIAAQRKQLWEAIVLYPPLPWYLVSECHLLYGLSLTQQLLPEHGWVAAGVKEGLPLGRERWVQVELIVHVCHKVLLQLIHTHGLV